MLNRTMCAAAVLVMTAGAAASARGVDGDETRAVVAEMLADADSRTSLLAADGGHQDGHFFLGSDDGAYSLTVYGLAQFRYMMSFRSDDNTVGARAGDDFESGFQTARTRIGMTGHVISRDWTYRVQGAFSQSTGSFGLEDAYVEYRLSEALGLRWGQFKLPLLREELVDDPYQLTVERSVMNSIFTQGRSQGVAMKWNSSWMNATAALSDGLNSANTDFTAPGGTGLVPIGEADWALTGRAEFLLAGAMQNMEDFTAPQGAPLGVMIGVAGHYQQSPNTPALGDVDRDLFEYTVDATIEGGGWNVFGAFVGRWDKFRAGAADVEFNDFGALVQAGIRVAPNTELFGRWDAVFMDDDRGLSEHDFHFVTVGGNQYIAGHAAKFTADAVVALDKTPDLVALGALPNTGVGLLGDGDSGEVAVRVQFQLMF